MWIPPWASTRLGAPPGKLRAITVWAEPPHRRGARGLWTLVVKWADSSHRVEVRGAYDVEDSDFQRVIDALPGPLVGGELFSGNTATVNERMYTEAWPVLASILKANE